MRLVVNARSGDGSLVPEAELNQMEGKELECIVDSDLKDFNEFFKSLDNSDLIPAEVALLKTYLWWKTHPQKATQDASPVDQA